MQQSLSCLYVWNTSARNQAVIERNNSSVYLLISQLCLLMKKEINKSIRNVKHSIIISYKKDFLTRPKCKDRYLIKCFQT